MNKYMYALTYVYVYVLYMYIELTEDLAPEFRIFPCWKLKPAVSGEGGSGVFDRNATGSHCGRKVCVNVSYRVDVKQVTDELLFRRDTSSSP